MSDSVFGNVSFPSSAITEAEVRETFDQFIDALKKGRLEALEHIYSDDYLLVRPDGKTLTKNEILDDLKKHAMTLTSFETAQVRIKAKGPVGVLTTETRNIFLRDGQEAKTHAQQVIVFFKTGKEVTITHFQSTNIAG